MSIQFKRTSSAPSGVSTPLAAGQPAWSSTDKRLYIGDGTTSSKTLSSYDWVGKQDYTNLNSNLSILSGDLTKEKNRAVGVESEIKTVLTTETENRTNFDNAHNNIENGSDGTNSVQQKECTATHDNSIALGLGTKTSRSGQVVVGQYNNNNSDALFIVGGGTSDTTDGRKTLLTVTSNGYTNASVFEADSLLITKKTLRVGSYYLNRQPTELKENEAAFNGKIQIKRPISEAERTSTITLDGSTGSGEFIKLSCNTIPSAANDVVRRAELDKCAKTNATNKFDLYQEAPMFQTDGSLGTVMYTDASISYTPKTDGVAGKAVNISFPKNESDAGTLITNSMINPQVQAVASGVRSVTIENWKAATEGTIFVVFKDADDKWYTCTMWIPGISTEKEIYYRTSTAKVSLVQLSFNTASKQLFIAETSPSTALVQVRYTQNL